MTHAVEQNQDGWFGEGDDMIFIDGDTAPTINGTGSEDYYTELGTLASSPSPTCTRARPTWWTRSALEAGTCLYRWHTERPHHL